MSWLHPNRPPLWIYLAVLLVLLPVSAQAHGSGSPVLTDVEAGPYRLFAWMDPEPPRVGAAHLAVVVLPALTEPTEPAVPDQPMTDVEVVVTFAPIDAPAQIFTTTLAGQSGIGGFFYEADIAFPHVAVWKTTVEVDGGAGQGAVSFDRQVLAARQVNWLLVCSISAGLLLFIGLLGRWNHRPTRE